LIIMDEADELFANEAIMREFLHQYLAPDSKTLTLSATFPPYILSRIEEALMEADETRIDPPTRVHHCVSTSTCSSQNPVRSNVEYFYTVMNAEQTIADVVKSILSSTPYNRVLITNCSIHEALHLRDNLISLPVSVLDSDRADLDSISEKILIDPHGFLSRGVNIQNLDLGISLSVPESKETILHQWARVGRDNMAGSKFFLIVSDDIDQLRYLEFQLGVAFQELNVSRRPIHPFQQHASTSERLDAIHRLLAQ
jgi:superfamily II DNA/RNA helicase